MRRKTILILLTILLSFCFVATGMAGEKGNARKGKYLFRKNCRACHKPNGKAQVMGPYEKTTKQWQEVFAPGKYKEFECKAEWEKLSEQDRQDILKYVIDGASDSTVPRGCG